MHKTILTSTGEGIFFYSILINLLNFYDVNNIHFRLLFFNCLISISVHKLHSRTYTLHTYQTHTAFTIVLFSPCTIFPGQNDFSCFADCVFVVIVLVSCLFVYLFFLFHQQAVYICYARKLVP